MDALKAALETALAERTTDSWLEVLQNAGLPCAPLNDIADVTRDPQLAARNMLISTDDGAGGRVRMAGNPIKLSRYEDPSVRDAAPDLDANRQEILSELAGGAPPPKQPGR